MLLYEAEVNVGEAEMPERVGGYTLLYEADVNIGEAEVGM
jgi:hypothetical protein